MLRVDCECQISLPDANGILTLPTAPLDGQPAILKLDEFSDTSGGEVTFHLELWGRDSNKRERMVAFSVRIPAFIGLVAMVSEMIRRDQARSDQAEKKLRGHR